MNYKNLLITTALEAGEEIMKFYNKGFKTNYKEDNSPVTEADIAANKIIINKLKKLGIVIVSEESVNLRYEERKKIREFWLIDPLDGTKQFVKKEDEFTVNIARIVDNFPVEGIVYAPALKKLYYGNLLEGAYIYDYNYSKLQISKLPLSNSPGLNIIISKSHLNRKTQLLVEKLKKKNPKIKICKIGSSLKFCCIAEGNVDMYPRIGAIREWDIAAGHAIVKSVGGKIVNLENMQEVSYNTSCFHTPDFLVYNNNEQLLDVLECLNVNN